MDTGVFRYEVLEPATATVLCAFLNTPDHTPALTVNKLEGYCNLPCHRIEGFGHGTCTRPFLCVCGDRAGPRTPEGVYARVVDGRTLYVNTTSQEQRVPIAGKRTGMITHRTYDGFVTLGPQEADLIP